MDPRISLAFCATAIIILIITLAIAIWGAVTHKNIATKIGVIGIAVSCLGILATFSSCKLPEPTILPPDVKLTEDNPFVTFDDYDFCEVYYSLDPGIEITRENSTKYEGEQIELYRNCTVSAKAFFLFLSSDQVSEEVTVNYGVFPFESGTSDSAVSRNKKTLDYLNLPAGISCGWGDNLEDGNGRMSLSSDQVYADKVLGTNVMLNSIKDGEYGHEKNFVSAIDADAVDGGYSDNTWSANLLEVLPEKSYYIRIWVHNDNPNGYECAAESVAASFEIPNYAGRTMAINGFIEAPNALPSRYWDGVALTCDDKFYIEYIQGSAKLWKISTTECLPLPDRIVDSMETIGYDALDGVLPGGKGYDVVLTIKVKVHAAV